MTKIEMAPAVKHPEGQAVVVTRPGRVPVKGIVAHIHSAPGFVTVLHDKDRSLQTYPESFVTEWKERRKMSSLEEQMAAEAARAEAERLAREAAMAQALKDAQAALDQSGVSIPPGAWGH